MSPLSVLLALLFSGFAVAAGVKAPLCTYLPLKWSVNSLSQNPCVVAAYLMSTCNAGDFTINALPGPGYHYTGPSGPADNSDLCKCNTVAYSLLSACDACQGANWIPWATYKYNCTKVLPPSTFPNPVPAGTRVPYWSLIDVTVKGTWDDVESQRIGDSPEAVPGILLG